MKRITRAAVAVALFGVSGSTLAQDGGNVVAALDRSVANVDMLVQSLADGSATGVSNSVAALGGDLAVSLADGTPLEPQAQELSGITDDVAAQFTEAVGSQLNEAGEQLAMAGEPVFGLLFPTSLLSGGLPFVEGEELVLFSQQCTPCENLTQAGIPVRSLNQLLTLDLLGPGDGDGGGVLVPVFGGEGLGALGSGELSGAGLLPTSDTEGLPGLDMLALSDGSGMPFEGSLPSLGSGEGIPVIGVLLPAGMSLVSGGGGLALDDLPIDSIDPASAMALTSNSALPGL